MQPVEASEVLEVLAHAQAQIEPGRLRHYRDAAANVHAVLGFERNPSNDGGARSRREQGAERADRSGLASAVRTKEPERLAVCDIEGDPRERGALAEAFGQIVNDERGLGGWTAAAGRTRGLGISSYRHGIG
jgi:hypothetical protein